MADAGTTGDGLLEGADASPGAGGAAGGTAADWERLRQPQVVQAVATRRSRNSRGIRSKGTAIAGSESHSPVIRSRGQTKITAPEILGFLVFSVTIQKGDDSSELVEHSVVLRQAKGVDGASEVPPLVSHRAGSCVDNGARSHERRVSGLVELLKVDYL